MKNKKKFLWFFGYEIVKFTLFFSVFGFSLNFAQAHKPMFPNPTGPDDYIYLHDVHISTAYYGTINDFPHTYRLEITEPTEFYAEILVPESVTEKNRNAILVREEKRGVSEVARLDPKEASWDSFFEVWVGDSYRRGQKIETTLQPGNYNFEVSTPENKGKYILVIGKEEKFSALDYFSTLADIYKIKVFMDKPFFMVLQSPLYYIPAIIIIMLGSYMWYRRHKIYD